MMAQEEEEQEEESDLSPGDQGSSGCWWLCLRCDVITFYLYSLLFYWSHVGPVSPLSPV